MNKKFQRTLALLLVILLAITMCVSSIVTTSASSGTLSYSFTNNQVGNAQGTISLNASAGTYNVCWADNSSVLKEFTPIATLTFSSTTTKSITMPANTAIPANATKVVAINTNSSTSKSTIYFVNNVNWSSVYCHAYNSANTSDRNASWPGVKMDYVGKNADGYGVYSIELNDSWNEFQFDNGSSGNKNQTVDITKGYNNAYIISNPSSSEKYSTNNISFSISNLKTSSLKTSTLKNATNTNTIYFINNIKWSNVYCHAYNSANTSDRNASWPGVKMNYVGKNSDGYGVYSIQLNSNWNEFQFDNGSGGNKNQTVDITIGTKNAYIISNPSTSEKYSTNNITYNVEVTEPTTVQPTTNQPSTIQNTTNTVPTSQATTPTVDNPAEFEGAYAVFNIPSNKLSNGKLVYSFASYSDIQLDSEKRAYPYSYTNFENAIELANTHNTDFIITSGDNVNNESSTKQATEWTDFEKILANSNYSNNVYEAIGNHELWGGLSSGTKMFIKNSGLDSNKDTIAKGKAYYEKTINGDHFIFMALENGFHAETCDEFSDEQLNWVENLLKKYSGDGHNIFLIEHSPIKNFGAGDKTDNPYYGGLMTESYSSTVKFKSLLTKYKDIIFLSGHTHIELAQQLNYSDNDGTSCQTIHNSSVGGSRKIVNNALNYNYSSTQSEGYIVNVYTDRIVFNGANITNGKFLPLSTYNVKTSANAIGVTPAFETNICGDVNSDGIINIVDATLIQMYLVAETNKNNITFKNADTDASLIVDIDDVTYIQEYCAKIQKSLPAPTNDITLYVDYTDFISKAKSILNNNYTYASYEQYVALKQIYTKALYNSLPHKNAYLKYAESIYKDFENLINNQTTPTSPDSNKNITVYFENNKNWSSVYAYVWSGSNNLASWNGTKMTYAGRSKNGYDVYSITFDYSSYSNIIFNNGSNQTVDIALDGTNNLAYYLSSDSNGKYNVGYTNVSNIW